MIKNVSILSLLAFLFISSAAFSQVEYTGPIKDFTSPAAQPEMPENSMSSQYPNLQLSAKTENYLISNPNFLVPIMVQFATSAEYTPGGSMSDYVNQLRASREAILESLGENSNAQVDRSFKYSPYVAMFANTTEIAKILALNGVVAITENGLSEPHLDVSTVQIGADVLHTQGIVGSGYSVAVLDSGIDPNHIAFTGRIPASACFNTNVDYGGGEMAVTNCPNGLEEQIDLTGGAAGTTCPDLNGGCFHGNHVAGIVGTNPLIVGPRNIIGVAPGADLIGLNVFSTFNVPAFCGSPAPCILSFTSDQMAALEWIYDNHATYNICAANMSLGGGQFFAACDGDSRAGIIQMLRDAGVATTISSGNNGFNDSVGAPGCISAAVTVGAVNSSDTPASFSNYGPGLVDLMAPGVSILSAFGVVGPNQFVAEVSGTSMAAPHVAGAFALLKSAFPDATLDEIEESLKLTGVPTADGPRIDVEAAFLRMEATRRGVPTLGEWAIICLGLIMCSIGIVAVRQRKMVLATSSDIA